MANGIIGRLYINCRIVPPDEAWDNIQRARHMARDPTFYKWPPAIRLFHPFLQKRSELVPAASSIGDIIEKYNIEPFTITLDQLLILPHWEVLEANEEAQKELPLQLSNDDDDNNNNNNNNNDATSSSVQSSSSSSSTDNNTSGSDLQSIQQLIESEERKGLQKFKKRIIKNRADSPMLQKINKTDKLVIPSRTIKTDYQLYQKIESI